MSIAAAARAHVRPDTSARTAHKASATLCSLQLVLSKHANRAIAAYSAATTILYFYAAGGRQIFCKHLFRTVIARAAISNILWIAICF
jgi:purine-cytosine permease-like protein